jgi:hypothetical protein
MKIKIICVTNSIFKPTHHYVVQQEPGSLGALI